MVKITYTFVLVLLLAGSSAICAQDQSQDEQVDFEDAAQGIQQKLAKSIADLNDLRQSIADETLDLNRKLNQLEGELVEVRAEYQKVTRTLDSRTLDLSNLRNEIKTRRQEAAYLSNLLSEYTRNFESRLHIAEIQRYSEPLEQATLAPENSNLTDQEIYETQARLLSVALERLNDSLGGTTFSGQAVDPSGLVKKGKFLMLGPSALFMSQDGRQVGTAEQRLGSLEPAIIPFGNPVDTQAAAQLIENGEGAFPLDPTGGNAHKIEQTQESLIEHVQKGGPVMIPIFALAGAAVAVAIYKWICLSFVRKPSSAKVNDLLDAVAEHDEETAMQKAKSIGGPVGSMLETGIKHLKEPRALIEEVMYEKVMATRLKLQRFLPFIAISAASAPLLGLLGTVTGIINTFKLITVFGSGDVKTLSGGISEALITTKFGLIVAIPSLLLHAFLSRKAKSIIDRMEKAAIALVNQIGKTPYRQNDVSQLFAELTGDQAQDLVRNIRNQSCSVESEPEYASDSAGGLMNRRVVSVRNDATVGEAISKIRTAKIGDDIDAVFVVNDSGKYVGHVLVRHLLTRPENARVESMTDPQPLFVRVDADSGDIQRLFNQHDLISLPVLDQDDQLVGRVSRNGNGDGK